MAEIFVLCGFFMIYIVEEVTHLVIDKTLRRSKEVRIQYYSHSRVSNFPTFWCPDFLGRDKGFPAGTGRETGQYFMYFLTILIPTNSHHGWSEDILLFNG